MGVCPCVVSSYVWLHLFRLERIWQGTWVFLEDVGTAEPEGGFWKNLLK